MAPHEHLDPYAKPPDIIRQTFKRYQKSRGADLDSDPDILDFEKELGHHEKFIKQVGSLDPKTVLPLLQAFEGDSSDISGHAKRLKDPISIFEHTLVPGLLLLPSLLPSNTQFTLLSRLLHRDLSNPLHKTNVHFHHSLPYPPHGQSFFSLSPTASSPVCTPHDPATHGPIPISALLARKLRWLTLGGQYDWSAKRYPPHDSPPFPPDLAALLQGLVANLSSPPQVQSLPPSASAPLAADDDEDSASSRHHDTLALTAAQAAIVNVYSPGDTLSMHRDVAEASARALVSVSLGCDALFVIALDSPPLHNPQEEEQQQQPSGAIPAPAREGLSSPDLPPSERVAQPPAAPVVVLRVRSGDALLMSGAARFAWHGVPQIVAGTCPDALKAWPARHGAGGGGAGWDGDVAGVRSTTEDDDGRGEVADDEFEQWRGWMANKRINLNARQMWD